MKKLLFLILLIPLFAIGQFKVPDRIIGTDIHDYTNTLSSEQKANLDTVIQSIRRMSSCELAVVILDDLQGVAPVDVATEIGREWGVGKSGVNNGIVYVLSPPLHKAGIAVGDGLEYVLTDLSTSQLQEGAKVYYRAGDYYQGILYVLNGIKTQLTPVSKEQLALEKEQEEKRMASFMEGLKYFMWGCAALAILTLIVWYGHYLKNKKLEQERILKEKYDKEKSDREIIAGFKVSLQLLPEYVKRSERSLNDALSALHTEFGIFRPYELDKLTFPLIKLSNQVFPNITADKVKEVRREITNQKGIIETYVSGIVSFKNNLMTARFTLEKTLKNLPELLEKAKDNLKNTPFKIDALNIPLYSSLFHLYKHPEDYIQGAKDAANLVAKYENIINYEANQKKLKEEAEKAKLAEAARKKREAEEEEEEEKKKKARRQSEDAYVSRPSYNFSGGSSSSNDTSYGGGSFSGGGSDGSGW